MAAAPTTTLNAMCAMAVRRAAGEAPNMAIAAVVVVPMLAPTTAAVACSKSMPPPSSATSTMAIEALEL